MPVIGRSGLGNQPSLVQSLHNLFWERSLLEIGEISLKLLEAADSHQDSIPTAIIHSQSRVMADPA